MNLNTHIEIKFHPIELIDTVGLLCGTSKRMEIPLFL